MRTKVISERNKLLILNITLYLVGFVLIIALLSPFMGINRDYVIKYDYFWQHIPYQEEFFRLLKNGLPFWSWNFFLGTNFWGSKVLSIIGDPFTWLTYFINLDVLDVKLSMTYVIVIKFLFGYTFFYLFLSKLKHNAFVKLLFSLVYIFSGWVTTFIEQPSFLSFYMVMPLMFIGVENYLSRKGFIVFTLSVALLISINYYFFWPAAVLLLIYWIYRFVIIHSQFSLMKFINESLALLFWAIIGLLISSPLWLPGLSHLSSSSRLGNFLYTYDAWDKLHVSSFVMFSFIPILKYLDGVFKDGWYYFNQFGIYFGSFSVLLLPHVFYAFENRKLRIANSIIVILMYALLISPKIGLLFHFAYSLRYTFILTFLGMIIAAQILENIAHFKWYVIGAVQIGVMLLYRLLYNFALPTVYVDLPYNLLELDLLAMIYKLTFVYTGILLLNAILKKILKEKYALKTVAIILIVMAGVYEMKTQGFYALTSQNSRESQDQALPYERGTGYQKAVDYLKSIDDGFYRIYQDNGYLSNINMHYDYHSISTYDSVFQYSLHDFLVWSRQYPNTNWEFRYTEPSFNKIMTVRYSIIDTTINENYMSDLWYFEQIGTDQDFGDYQLFKYKEDVHMAYTYNSIDSIETVNEYTKDDGEYYLYIVGDMLNNTIYLDDNQYSLADYSEYVGQEGFAAKGIDPISYHQNSVEFAFDLESNALVFFSIPFDSGWKIIDNGQDIEPMNVQGGFIGLPLRAGYHELSFSFTPSGLNKAFLISKVGVSILVLISVVKASVILYRRIKNRRTGMIAG